MVSCTSCRRATVQVEHPRTFVIPEALASHTSPHLVERKVESFQLSSASELLTARCSPRELAVAVDGTHAHHRH
eukprot:14499726-Heterocapsa_arctica.AAC.1